MALAEYPWRRGLALTFIAFLLAAFGQAQQKPDIDPLELVRQAAHNEIKASDVQYYAMFKDTTQYKDHSITKEILRTKDGGLTTTLLINGRPLTPEQRQKDNEQAAEIR